MLRSSSAESYEEADVPVIHDDDDEVPPVRPITPLFTVWPPAQQAREARRAKARARALALTARDRRDSVVPVGITIPPPAPTGFGAAAAALTETRSLNALMSRLNRTTAIFATAIVGLLVLLVVKGQLAKSATAEPEESPQPAALLPAPSPAQPVAKAEAKPRAEAAAAPTAPTIEKIEVGLSANAPGAQFRIDDGPWLANPYTGHVPQDARDHRVEARADGYFPRVAMVHFTKDTLLEVTLQKFSSYAAPTKPAKRKEPAPSTRPAPPPTAPAATEESHSPSTPDAAHARTPRPIELKTPYE